MENWAQMCKRDSEKKKMFGNIFVLEIYSRYIEISKLNFGNISTIWSCWATMIGIEVSIESIFERNFESKFSMVK